MDALSSGEKLFPVLDAVEQVTGDRHSYSNLWRWMQRGVLLPDGERVRLEFVKCGARRKCSLEAVRRFLVAQTEAVSGNGAAAALPANRRHEIAQSADEAELIAKGA